MPSKKELKFDLRFALNSEAILRAFYEKQFADRQELRSWAQRILRRHAEGRALDETDLNNFIRRAAE